MNTLQGHRQSHNFATTETALCQTETWSWMYSCPAACEKHCRTRKLMQHQLDMPRGSLCTFGINKFEAYAGA